MPTVIFENSRLGGDKNVNQSCIINIQNTTSGIKIKPGENPLTRLERLPSSDGGTNEGGAKEETSHSPEMPTTLSFLEQTL